MISILSNVYVYVMYMSWLESLIICSEMAVYCIGCVSGCYGYECIFNGDVIIGCLGWLKVQHNDIQVEHIWFF
jgi:hypothetical protein